MNKSRIYIVLYCEVPEVIINKTDCNDITKILLKVALKTITLTLTCSDKIYHKTTGQPVL
jgi:hypothetical protein